MIVALTASIKWRFVNYLIVLNIVSYFALVQVCFELKKLIRKRVKCLVFADLPGVLPACSRDLCALLLLLGKPQSFYT